MEIARIMDNVVFGTYSLTGRKGDIIMKQKGILNENVEIWGQKPYSLDPRERARVSVSNVAKSLKPIHVKRVGSFLVT